MIRLPNWREELSYYLSAFENRVFKYGQYDCALFASGAVECQFGCVIFPECRGLYNTRAAGMQLMAEQGYDGYIGLFSSVMRPVNLLQAKVGDVATMGKGKYPLLGVVAGSHCVFTSKIGTTMRPLTSISGAFTL